MPEKLPFEELEEELSNQRKILKEIKILPSHLRAGIYTVHEFPPTKKEKREYEKAIDALSSALDKMPVATYDVYLIGQGSFHTLEIGISNLKESNKEVLEGMVYDIFNTIEENSRWRPCDPGIRHGRNEINEVMNNLKKNKGDLEYFDRIHFHLYH